jgi:hypothetical protein
MPRASCGKEDGQSRIWKKTSCASKSRIVVGGRARERIATTALFPDETDNSIILKSTEETRRKFCDTSFNGTFTERFQRCFFKQRCGRSLRPGMEKKKAWVDLTVARRQRGAEVEVFRQTGLDIPRESL